MMLNFTVGVVDGHAAYEPIPPATEAEVQAVEAIISHRIQNARLPHAYRNFLMTANGGLHQNPDVADESLCFQVTHPDIPPDSELAEFELTWLLTLNKQYLDERIRSDGVNFLSGNDHLTLQYNTEHWVADDWGGEMANYFAYIPEDILPVGEVRGFWAGRHELLVIGIQGPRYGKVYVLRYFDEEWEIDLWKRPENERLNPEQFLFFIADDFDEFLSKLHACEIEK